MTKAISVYVPRGLYEKVREKMKAEGFEKYSRLCVYLLRRWVDS